MFHRRMIFVKLKPQQESIYKLELHKNGEAVDHAGYIGKSTLFH